MGNSGSLKKMEIRAYSDEGFGSQVGSFTVMINPESYSHSHGVCYKRATAQGSSGSSSKFNRIAKDRVDFELVFDGTGVVPTSLPGVVPYSEDGVADQVEAFKSLVFDYSGQIHRPNYVKLVWGTLLFRCQLRSLNISYTLFKPDGTPLRARARANFIGYTEEKELAQEANKSSPDMTHLVTVRVGDRLPLLCHQIYGESALYLAVAEVNELTDFRRLEPGSQLVFPPRAEVEEASP